MLSYVKNMKYLYIRIALVCLTLGIGLFFVFSQQYFDTEYCKSKSFDDIRALQIHQGDVIDQTIVFDHSRLHSIGISAVNMTKNCKGAIEISLVDDNNNKIWSETTNADDFALQKVKWYRVKNDVIIQQRYTLHISSQDLNGSIQFGGVASEKAASGVIDAVVLNSTQQKDTTLFVEMTYSQRLDNKTKLIILLWMFVAVIYILGFEILFSDKRRGIITVVSTLILLIISMYFKLAIMFPERQNYILFAGVVILALFAIAFCAVLLNKRCKKAEVYFAITVGTFGILYAILLPPFSAPDENSHYSAAYRISNAIMGQPIDDESGRLYKRECDLVPSEKILSNQYVIDKLGSLISGENTMSQAMIVTGVGYVPDVPITLYIPQAVGISIGKILHVNNARLLYCGRLMNLFCFMLITFFAIRMIPYGKWIIFAICQIPLVLEIVSSYSYDAIILAFTFLLIAYIIKLNEQKEQISKKQWCILTIISVIYAPLKPVYLPFVALVFIIPNKKICNQTVKSVLYKSGVVVLSLLAVLAVYKGKLFTVSSFTNEKIIQISDDVEAGEMVIDETKDIVIVDNDHYTRPNIQFIIENPFDLVESFSGAVINFLDELLLAAFGKYLSWYDVILPTYVSILVMILFGFSYTSEDYHIISNMTITKKGWVVLMAFGCWFAVFLTAYLKMTNPSLKLLAGIQGRYFIPSLALVAFLLRGKHVKNVENDCIMVMTSGLIQILTVMSICSIIWSR